MEVWCEMCVPCWSAPRGVIQGLLSVSKQVAHATPTSTYKTVLHVEARLLRGGQECWVHGVEMTEARGRVDTLVTKEEAGRSVILGRLQEGLLLLRHGECVEVHGGIKGETCALGVHC